MTDRDLFYCGGFNCDGHARSNEKCEPDLYERTTEAVYGEPVSYCDRVLGVVHTAADHDACERRRINALREKGAPKYTVSGNRARLFRLDEHGNQTGEAIEFPGPVSFDIPEGSVSEATVLQSKEGWADITLDISMGYVDPALIALLTGYGTPPEEMTLVTLPTRWQRFKAWLLLPYWRKVKGWFR